MDISVLRLGMWMSRSLVRLLIFVDNVSVSLSFSKYRPPHCYLLSEMCLHRTSGVGKTRVNSRILFLVVACYKPRIYQVINLTGS